MSDVDQSLTTTENRTNNNDLQENDNEVTKNDGVGDDENTDIISNKQNLPVDHSTIKIEESVLHNENMNASNDENAKQEFSDIVLNDADSSKSENETAREITSDIAQNGTTAVQKENDTLSEVELSNNSHAKITEAVGEGDEDYVHSDIHGQHGSEMEETTSHLNESYKPLSPSEQQPKQQLLNENDSLDGDNSNSLLKNIHDKSNKDASAYLLNTLVDGDFDLDKNYIIQKPKNLTQILTIWPKLSSSLQAKNAVKLLNVLKAMPYRYGPDEFFNFPGRKGSGIVLPPIKSWPYQNGFTITCWFRIDPVCNSIIEKEKPYLYWFCTSKGLGYSAHFVGNCLVISYAKMKEKGFQHCIQYEFKPREWYMVTFSHQYQRWGKSSVHCYINGQLVSSAYFPWPIENQELFDKCYIGCTPDRSELTSFSGQMSTFFLFSFYLEPLIVHGLYKLGPAYKNQFKFENESAHVLTEPQRKAMYDGKLMNSIVFSYNPISCDEQLVLQSAPKNNISYFVHNAHAQMLSNVRAVIAHSLYSTLHSVGGIQVFFSLFGQLDYPQIDGTIDYDVCSSLLATICDLIERSYTIQHQMLSYKGFLTIGYYLEKTSRQHINQNVLNSLISLTRFFAKLQSKNSPLLLKQLFVHIFFNPVIWIYCSVDTQMVLYTYLATEFVTYADIYNSIQPISGIIQTLHTLKYYYWVIDPLHRSGYEPKGTEGNRPSAAQIIEIRQFMLLYMKQLIITGPGIQEDELQAILSYLHTVHEDENNIDVLNMLVTLMSEHPKSMVPAFDRRQGLRTVFKLLESSSEMTRLQALKLLGFFLQRSTTKRKTDSMQPHNLFSLLADRLLLHANEFTLATYDVLLEILVEKISGSSEEKRSVNITSEWKIENPAMIKVIATLLRNSPDNLHLYEIKMRYLEDLIALSVDSRDNRRIILQMSVWQDYLLGLAYIYPTTHEQIEITDLVFKLFKILLHHAIKYEFGGWRVWIDTLSILHGKVTKEDYHKKISKMVEHMKDDDDADKIHPSTPKSSQAEISTDSATTISTPTSKSTVTNRQVFNKTGQLPPFNISEFKYSPMHIRLLHSVFDTIEEDVRSLRSDPTKSISDYINHNDNQIFCVNVVHIISQMADILCNASGGLLPLLASATSASHEIEILENTEGLTPVEALKILKRIMAFVDLFVIANNGNFTELEQEKNMPSGGIVRQCLRLTMTVAVRQCMECRFQRFDTTRIPQQQLTAKQSQQKLSAKDPVEAVLELTQLMTQNDQEHIENYRANESDDILLLLSSLIKNPDSVLQELDVHRLRALIYRDVDDTKQSQFLALAIVYFASVLMVSRYRDIIETNQTSLSRTTSIVSSSPSVRNGTNGFVGPNVDTASVNGVTVPVSNNSQIDAESLGKSTTDSTNPPTISQLAIASIPIDNPLTSDKEKYAEIVKNNTRLPEYPKTNFASSETQSSMNITEKLERALSNVAPFLRDVFTEFSQLLTKTLVGSHGQELLPGGLNALKQTTNVVELVMLLCSQEWQNSLQKHAGLAFIELVNEGRLLSHASKDHVVKVANEADFILNRMRADDVRKASEYEQLCAQTTLERQEEERLCNHFLCAARKRHQSVAIKMKEKCSTTMANDKNIYLNTINKNLKTYWKLDAWEDDLRRRRRISKNLKGSSHTEAVLKVNISQGRGYASIDERVFRQFFPYKLGVANEDAINAVAKEDGFHKQLRQKSQSFVQTSDDEDTLQVDEKDLDQEFSGIIKGTLVITSNAMLYDTDENDETFDTFDKKVLQYVENLNGKWNFSEIRAIFSRRYLLQDKALEIFVSNRTSIMFAFPDRGTVKKVVNYLPRVGVGGRYGLPQQRRTSLASPKQLFRSANMTQRWQRRELSNFEYLMYLNTIAGRTYQDLNQYPVCPWIIADYESEKIDLNSPATYRDLSKPIGALNPTRKAFFVDRYHKWNNDSIPPFHYGTHYSTAAFTLNWLIRLEPFTTYLLSLQDGKFDNANRTFHSIPVSWQNCQRDTSDVKELIPEFFFLPEMFVNTNNYKFGTTEDDLKVDDVLLPKWAATPEEFVRLNRMALESEFVSCQLHHWIDLIFGYKQRGPEAQRAVNLFYYMTYEGAINLDAITNPIDRAAVETQIKNFGQTPSQLLTEPHPPRNSAMALAPMVYNQITEDVSMIMKFSSNAPIIHVSANTNPSIPLQAVLTISQKHDFSINKYNQASGTTPQGFTDTTVGASHSALPLSMDSLLVLNTGLQRRHLGNNFDERLQQRQQNFMVTADNRFIVATGFWDKSFRVLNTDNAKITQVLYGHFDIVTCICRSEITVAGNCFITTGSRDCTVCIWIWNGTKGAVVDREYPNQDINPSPAAILTGHDSEITCLWISAELGIVLSGGENGLVLEHTLNGDVLRSFENPLPTDIPRIISPSNDGDIIVCYDRSKLCLYTLNGKLMRQAIFEDEIIQSLEVNTDGQYTVIGGDRGFVQIIRTYDLQPVYAYPQCDASIRSLAITHDQKYIMAGLSTGCLIVFNVNFPAIGHRRDSASPLNPTASATSLSSSSSSAKVPPLEQSTPTSTRK
ncbi:unnamed protein product [Didymodactylos carnosus]|uniref:Neurobeachin n=1 Tax=Didymodactylos carnosus TaxID=1234261 RepID=A0A8S2GJ16_9BILA|nr:unnamed protein product [Didymodactylos carnosus]CAF3524124.1 unnamed protein product [Didymodactylos carnosus]